MKKITVKMLKSDAMPSVEELGEFISSVREVAEKYKKEKGTEISAEEILKELSPLGEEDCEFIAGIGFAVLYLMKGVCTPAAWKYMVEDMKKYMF